MKVITRLNGGLGNQLFQLAFGLALTTELETELWLDTRGLDNLALRSRQTTRQLELDLYTDLRFLSSKDTEVPPILEVIRNGGRSSLHSIASRVASHLLGSCHFRESKADLTEISDLRLRFSNCDFVYTEGHWATPTYADRVRTKLLTHLQFSGPIPSRLGEIKRQMNDNDALALHVRRGDFATSARKMHGVLSENYFFRALENFEFTSQQVFIFSDDEAWCRKKFPTLSGATFVSEKPGERPAHHLHLLSQASRFILSNSSFSWWAAWLAESQAPKVVIRPSLWDRQTNGIGVYPSHWRELHAD